MQISSSIEIPKNGVGRSNKYPWDAMVVGDSFLIEGAIVQKIGPLLNYRAKTRGEKYTCRTVEGGVRVWRVA